jgi:hypothetical protein
VLASGLQSNQSEVREKSGCCRVVVPPRFDASSLLCTPPIDYNYVSMCDDGWMDGWMDGWID